MSMTGHYRGSYMRMVTAVDISRPRRQAGWGIEPALSAQHMGDALIVLNVAENTHDMR